MDGDVGVGSDDLLLWVEVRVLLEVKVAKRAREGEVAVHSAKLNKAAGSDDARRLALVGGLVVERERLGLAADGHDGARVARVGLRRIGQR